METIKFEDIKKANETILTTNIKGKDYAEVNQRIKAFRMLYPTGTIETEMLSNENGVCVFKASVFIPEYDEEAKSNGVYIVNHNRLLGTGTAYEKENSTFINKTSYIENCETSAVGRALAMCGFGIDTSIASAEEVQNAIAQQSMTDEKAKLIEKMQELVVTTETELKTILDHYKVKHDVELTEKQLQEIVTHLEKKAQ